MHSGTFLVQCQRIRSTGTRRRSEQRPGDQVWVTDSRLCPAVEVRFVRFPRACVTPGPAFRCSHIWSDGGSVPCWKSCCKFCLRSLLDPMFQKVGVYLRYNIVAFTFRMFQHINHWLWWDVIPYPSIAKWKSKTFANFELKLYTSSNKETFIALWNFLRRQSRKFIINLMWRCWGSSTSVWMCCEWRQFCAVSTSYRTGLQKVELRWLYNVFI